MYGLCSILGVFGWEVWKLWMVMNNNYFVFDWKSCVLLNGNGMQYS